MPIKKTIKKKKVKKEVLAAKVIHYYDKLKVAVLKLKAEIKVGDELHFLGGKETDFKQKVSSMQIDHKALKRAKKGQEVGLKVKIAVREGYKVLK